MMNLGVVLPEPGYLQAVRDITKKHGIVLIFDEVKTGICTAAGGAVERCGVVPDMVTLAKALAGGLPSGAIGGSEEVMAGRQERQGLPGGHLQRQPALHGRRPRQPGTGHDRRCLQAPQLPERPPHHRVRRRLRQVRLPRLHGRHLVQGLRQLRHRQDHRLRVVHQVPGRRALHLAWLYNINRGVIIAPGREEEWTLSVNTPTRTSTGTWARSRAWSAT